MTFTSYASINEFLSESHIHEYDNYFYDENYSVQEIEIDGTLYFINENIEITDDLINCIRANADKLNMNPAVEDFEHIHNKHITEYPEEYQEFINFESFTQKVEIGEIIYYFDKDVEITEDMISILENKEIISDKNNSEEDFESANMAAYCP